MRTHPHSYVDPTTKAWLLARLNTPSFRLYLPHFLTMLHICLSIPHPTIARIS